MEWEVEGNGGLLLGKNTLSPRQHGTLLHRFEQRPTSNAESEDKDKGEEMKRGVISLGGMSRSTCGLSWSICPPCYLGLKNCCRNVCPDGGILQSWRWSALAYSCSVGKSWLTLEISISGLCAHIFERSDIEKDSREVLTVLRKIGRTAQCESFVRGEISF